MPEGLQSFPTVVDVPIGVTKIVRIPIQNITKHIFLPAKTILSSIEDIAESEHVNIQLSTQILPEPSDDILICTTDVNSTSDSFHDVETNKGTISCSCPNMSRRLYSKCFMRNLLCLLVRMEIWVHS